MARKVEQQGRCCPVDQDADPELNGLGRLPVLGHIFIGSERQIQITAYTANIPTRNRMYKEIGSSCDVTISSDTNRNGTITSPSYPSPYPAKTTCTYEFQGRGKERVQIVFQDFSLYIPNANAKNCDNTDSLTVFIHIDGRIEKIDKFCGTTLPKPIMSNGPRLKLEFQSFYTSRYSRGFKSTYAFMEIKTLILLYLYINEATRCEAVSASDYVEFSNYLTRDRKFSRYCGQLKEFDVESDRKFFRVTFRSNDRLDGTGFNATFKFVMGKENHGKKQSTSVNASTFIKGTCLLVMLSLISLTKINT
ncbi:unnamed protein product [Diabrotica balteata]|uniref:CUB domain-containing protein n=1 Tax=Diabrotica balteata TaxID=107213 RepID=A0A9N9T686_DIABA|nr:unnamed protein product [Diabrotica balteata]